MLATVVKDFPGEQGNLGGRGEGVGVEGDLTPVRWRG